MQLDFLLSRNKGGNNAVIDIEAVHDHDIDTDHYPLITRIRATFKVEET